MQVFAHPLPYNIIPHIDVFQDNMYTKEEMKVRPASAHALLLPVMVPPSPLSPLSPQTRHCRTHRLDNTHPSHPPSCPPSPLPLPAPAPAQVTWESRKIMASPELKLSVTAVRIPTLRAHSESITLETAEKVRLQ